MDAVSNRSHTAYDGVSDGWVLIRVFHVCREVEAQFTELNTAPPPPPRESSAVNRPPGAICACCIVDNMFLLNVSKSVVDIVTSIQMLPCASSCSKDTLLQSQTTPKKSNHSCMLSNGQSRLMLPVIPQIPPLAHLQLLSSSLCNTPSFPVFIRVASLPFFFNYDVDFWERTSC